MLKFFKIFFEYDDTIIGLCGFKGKLVPMEFYIKHKCKGKTKTNEFLQNRNSLLNCNYKCNNFKINLADNILLF